MKKYIFISLFMGLLCFSFTSKAQLLDEKNVTITMDLMPILQLDMTTPNQIDFVFNEIKDYLGGIVKYGATVLKVSSTVNWDLWAVGHSNGNIGGAYWDKQVQYGVINGTNGGVNTIPLSALELHQYPDNLRTSGATGLNGDYGANLITYSPVGQQVVVAGTQESPNSVYYATSNYYTRPAVTEKYIYGHYSSGITAAGIGGSYLTQGVTNGPGNTAGAGSQGSADYYYFIIDYRIVPGLPVQFPLANKGGVANTREALGSGSFANPGVYSMNVKYIMMEDI